ncbi:MAG TPA: hypothetical protein VLF62_05840 [Candidatus Saccharimonadales bacterium]|nr:hypothetical protein [Candidatus Saccharimonadales bacterium]
MGEGAPIPGPEPTGPQPAPSVEAQVEGIFTPGDERAMDDLDLKQIAEKVQADFDALQPTSGSDTEGQSAPDTPNPDDPGEVMFKIEATNELNQMDLGRAVDEATGLAPKPVWTQPTPSNVAALAESMSQLMPSGQTVPQAIEAARAASQPDFTQMRREYTGQSAPDNTANPPEQQPPAGPHDDKKGEQ